MLNKEHYEKLLQESLIKNGYLPKPSFEERLQELFHEKFHYLSLKDTSYTDEEVVDEEKCLPNYIQTLPYDNTARTPKKVERRGEAIKDRIEDTEVEIEVMQQFIEKAEKKINELDEEIKDLEKEQNKIGRQFSKAQKEFLEADDELEKALKDPKLLDERKDTIDKIKKLWDDMQNFQHYYDMYQMELDSDYRDEGGFELDISLTANDYKRMGKLEKEINKEINILDNLYKNGITTSDEENDALNNLSDLFVDYSDYVREPRNHDIDEIAGIRHDAEKDAPQWLNDLQKTPKSVKDKEQKRDNAKKDLDNLTKQSEENEQKISDKKENKKHFENALQETKKEKKDKENELKDYKEQQKKNQQKKDEIKQEGKSMGKSEKDIALEMYVRFTKQ